MAKLESEFALDLKEELRSRFPGCFITKLDPNQVQGIPDLLILWGGSGLFLRLNVGSALFVNRTKNITWRCLMKCLLPLSYTRSIIVKFWTTWKERLGYDF